MALQFFGFLCKPHIWEDSGSQVIGQYALIQIRLQDPLIINISGSNISISDFLHGDICRGKVACEITTFG